MGKSKAIPVAFADREWMSTGEAMGFCLVDNYTTFKKNYIEQGLKYWRKVGRIVYYRKKDVAAFLDKNGEKPAEYYNPFVKEVK